MAIVTLNELNVETREKKSKEFAFSIDETNAFVKEVLKGDEGNEIRFLKVIRDLMHALSASKNLWFEGGEIKDASLEVNLIRNDSKRGEGFDALCSLLSKLKTGLNGGLDKSKQDEKMPLGVFVAIKVSMEKKILWTKLSHEQALNSFDNDPLMSLLNDYEATRMIRNTSAFRRLNEKDDFSWVASPIYGMYKKELPNGLNEMLGVKNFPFVMFGSETVTTKEAKEILASLNGDKIKALEDKNGEGEDDLKKIWSYCLLREKLENERKALLKGSKKGVSRKKGKI